MADAPLESRRTQDRTGWIAVALVLLVIAVYAPTFGHPFVQWDDQVLIYENPSYNPPTWHSLGAFWTQPFRHLYQPISFSVWAVIACFAQTPGHALSPIYFHAASIVTHAATVVTAFALIRRLLTDVRAAALGAGFFALHPLLADPVNWASCFYTLLASALSVAAVVAFDLFAVEVTQRGKYSLYLLATLLFAAACLSKASAVVAIGLATVVLFYRTRDPVRKALVLLPWMLIAVPVIVVARRVQPASIVADLDLPHRALIALDTAAFYSCKVAWPWPMTIDYGRTPEVVMGFLVSTRLWDRLEENLLLLLPILISTFAVLWRKQWPELLLGWAWFVISLLPVSGLTKFEFQHISTVADRYAALAMVGPAIVVAGAIRRWPRIWPVTIAVLLGCAVATMVQSTAWRDTHTLMTRAERINPHSKVASAVLAEMLASAGQPGQAETEFRRAIDNDPAAATPHFDFANLLAGEGRLSDSIAQYRLAIDADPASTAAYLNLGVALARTGDPSGSLAAFQRAIELNPHDAEAYADLGTVLSRQGNKTAAAASFEHALKLNPTLVQALNGLRILNSVENSRNN